MSTEDVETEENEIEYGPCGVDDVEDVHKFVIDSGWVIGSRMSTGFVSC